MIEEWQYSWVTCQQILMRLEQKLRSTIGRDLDWNPRAHRSRGWYEKIKCRAIRNSICELLVLLLTDTNFDSKRVMFFWSFFPLNSYATLLSSAPSTKLVQLMAVCDRSHDFFRLAWVSLKIKLVIKRSRANYNSKSCKLNKLARLIGRSNLFIRNSSPSISGSQTRHSCKQNFIFSENELARGYTSALPLVIRSDTPTYTPTISYALTLALALVFAPSSTIYKMRYTDENH